MYYLTIISIVISCRIVEFGNKSFIHSNGFFVGVCFRGQWEDSSGYIGPSLSFAL
jgi:hypothetical protein